MGKSEEIVGKAVKKFNIPRSQLVITTTCFFSIEPAVLASGHIDLQMLMTNDGPWSTGRGYRGSISLTPWT